VEYSGSGTSSRTWLLTDERGSITARTDSTGAATAINSYDEYGNPDASNIGRFGYTVQIWLADAGVWHYKARAYHPGLGRFMQTDPIGQAGGMNIYAYVGGDPVNMVDPSGLVRSVARYDNCRNTGRRDEQGRQIMVCWNNPVGGDIGVQGGGGIPGGGNDGLTGGGLGGESGGGSESSDEVGCPTGSSSGAESSNPRGERFESLAAAVSAASHVVQAAQSADMTYGQSTRGSASGRHARGLLIYGRPGNYRINMPMGLTDIPHLGASDVRGQVMHVHSSLMRRGIFGVPNDNVAIVGSSGWGQAGRGDVFASPHSLLREARLQAVYRATNNQGGYEVMTTDGTNCGAAR
jgi:RHS repeat-associated protein